MKIQIPNDWAGVTLKEYQAYISLLKEAEERKETSTNKDLTEFETKCAIISLFSGEDMDEIMLLDMYSINRLINSLEFLKHPVVGKLKSTTKINGTRYYFEKRPTKMNAGQWVTL